MLEIQFKPNENEINVLNTATEDYGRVTIRHSNEDEKGGFGCKVLPAHGQIGCIAKSIPNEESQVDTLAVTSEGILLQYFSNLDTDGKFMKSSNKIVAKRKIVEVVFEDLYSLHSPERSLHGGNGILSEFVDIIFAFINKEYRENEEKWNYEQYLFEKEGIELKQTEGTKIVLSKCVVLMDFLNVSHEEMAEYFLEFTQ